MEQITSYDFQVPAPLIAQHPLTERDHSRLLVRSVSGELRDCSILDLPELLSPASLLIINDTQVFPARLLGKTRYGGQIELFLMEHPYPTGPATTVRAIGKPMRKLKPGSQVQLPGGIHGEVISKSNQTVGGLPLLDLRFPISFQEFMIWIENHGYIPLPSYIKRADPQQASISSDKSRYQTIYAREQGSVAAPTAGLHFSERLLQALQGRGIDIAPVTLHVGGGTFLPVKTDHISEHRMHDERFKVSRATLTSIRRAQAEERPIIVVGTTALRSLEGLRRIALTSGTTLEQCADQWHKTDLFIHPKPESPNFRPWAASALLTNFHQPKSTLFMLICALIGLDQTHALYQHAVAQEYRFFSYGDANLLWLNA